MNYFDKEANIFSYFRGMFREEETLLLPDTKEIRDLIIGIQDNAIWNKWIDSSGKSELPPDFYCPEFKLMMEVMRVDDHTYKNRKGKLLNPTNAYESKMQNEIKQSGILDVVSRDCANICIPNTDLSTEGDHNYIYYQDCFEHTIKHHAKKIDQYRNNHPKFKLIFFIFDESSAYLQTITPLEPTWAGKQMQGMAHQHWADKVFIQSLIDLDIDYIIWYTPFKLIRLTDGRIFPQPKTCVIDVKNIAIELIQYNEKFMVSSEV